MLHGALFGAGFFGAGISWVYISIHTFGHVHPLAAGLVISKHAMLNLGSELDALPGIVDRHQKVVGGISQRLGAGEIVLNCMSSDGTRDGYDIKQLRAARAMTTIPLIASGGAGAPEHFERVFRLAAVDGALAATVFYSGQIPIPELKSFLNREGIGVRPC